MKKLFIILILLSTMLIGCAEEINNETQYPEKEVKPSFTMYQVPYDDRFGRFLDLDFDDNQDRLIAKYMSNDGTTQTLLIYNYKGEIQEGYQIKVK